ncbi:PREDICTED: serine/arginine repetitive matrix protein 1-like [Eufriesea mexicana]|uniref:serine/arginine repetitive matrix protein 1-like n=1 Tax=Eufriesea mexicana TaxID=516756 RepID=UPI00083C6927|nr:PREDICTED: serine/arginine repetitive matrix protein 1-like [Eufriesea mexicana]
MSLDTMQILRGPPSWRTSTRCIAFVSSGWRLDRRYLCESDNVFWRPPHLGRLHEGLELRGLERMRRLDDGHAQRPPPFRVLAAPDGNYLSPTAMPPPPPRAPDPYKIAPSATSSSRAHRRSSFVIIADSRSVSPEARSPSPTLAVGRVSPFRGRGFRGPPPRSKSRPQSPETGDARRRGRIERRVSVSQQSSPRKSLIPQPTRQRSTSLSKSTERLSSPKLSRRVDSRARLNTTDSRNRLNASGNSNSVTNLASRRQATKTPSKLSPIQGTPTKPERTPKFTKRDRSKESTRLSPSKHQKYAASPSRHAWNAKKQNHEKGPAPGKTPAKERLTSPSKIPLKTNRVSSNSLNPARFITLSDQPYGKNKKAADKGSKDVRTSSEQTNESSQGSKQSDTGSKGSQASEKNSSSERIADLHLIDLLKQTSSATGTSSVVNTTATTAVQPLHIDANAVLLEKDVSERRNISEKTKSQQDLSYSKSSNSSNDDSATRQTQNTQVVNGEDHRQTSHQMSRSNKPNGNYGRTKGGTESRNDSPVPSDTANSHSKSNNASQSVKSVSKVISAMNNTGSATQRSNRVQTTSNDQNTKNTRSSDHKTEEASSFQPVSTVNPTKTNEIVSASDSARNSSSTGTQRTAASIASGSVKQEDARTLSRSMNSSEMKAVANATTVTVKSTSVSDQSSVASRANNVSSVVGAVSNDSKNVNSAGVKARPNNHGSGTSLKSSARVSVDSIESVRSTDTGVSVDTVRGVSSPREKMGMHVVKRAQEIETLSGNVVHLEQNGEPA